MSLRAFLTLCLLLCLSSLALANQPATSPQAPATAVTQAPAVTAPAVPAPTGAIAEVPAWLKATQSNSSKQPDTKAPLDGVYASCTACGSQYAACRNACNPNDSGCLSACQDDYQCCLQLCRGGTCF
jgi:hypothetical protein